ncbi:MAG: DUF6249 domain-containing protein [Candidatus Neomarinimicrobiota bacterium]|jgi:hypothetical protein|nr:DUF6249 domain-containing protein [Candidatus Neomarinimicrobiota bacterium]MEC9437206.1 DUF6249 domain-containing protein [Candidatus Neomarinimicrobiota bacterium]MEE3302938.1 DUF6249 domain-containing protein [Candidatus Neomarinimicrobiota bacterium]|tara:strand:+ start:66 stop:455 length:390 start_codon:yes stop_codon:yes gene_type:complete
MLQLVPILGVLAGIIIPVSVFIWLYFEGKDKNKTIIKIAKHMDDPSKAEEFLRILDERKKEPIDYRRGGVITMFVGIGIYLLGFTVMGSLFEGIGLLVGTIGAGSIIAGYLYPNTSEELTNAVEKFEKK